MSANRADQPDSVFPPFEFRTGGGAVWQEEASSEPHAGDRVFPVLRKGHVEQGHSQEKAFSLQETAALISASTGLPQHPNMPMEAASAKDEGNFYQLLVRIYTGRKFPAPEDGMKAIALECRSVQVKWAPFARSLPSVGTPLFPAGVTLTDLVRDCKRHCLADIHQRFAG